MLTLEQVKDWAKEQTEEYYCERCMIPMKHTADGKWRCRNSVCPNDTPEDTPEIED